MEDIRPKYVELQQSCLPSSYDIHVGECTLALGSDFEWVWNLHVQGNDPSTFSLRVRRAVIAAPVRWRFVIRRRTPKSTHCFAKCHCYLGRHWDPKTPEP